MEKRCLVLGGTGAVGEQVCRALASQGARVSFTYHANHARAQELAAELAAAPLAVFRLDAEDASEVVRVVDAAVAALGGLDALVHCIAIGPRKGASEAIADVDAATFDRVFAVNVRSAFFACQRAACAMHDLGGAIVLLGSLASAKPVPSPATYAATKGALSSLAGSLAKELGPRGICVNVVAPGLLTEGISSALSEELHREYLKHSAQKRLGRPQEIAATVAMLALRDRYVTGRTIVLDGGL